MRIQDPHFCGGKNSPLAVTGGQPFMTLRGRNDPAPRVSGWTRSRREILAEDASKNLKRNFLIRMARVKPMEDVIDA